MQEGQTRRRKPASWSRLHSIFIITTIISVIVIIILKETQRLREVEEASQPDVGPRALLPSHLPIPG